MSLILCSENGMPGFVDSDDLPCTDGNPCYERLIEIAVALERAGFEGVRVRCTPIGSEHSVITTSLLQNSFGARLMEFFADYARKQKIIFSVDTALQIASAIQESEAQNDSR